MNAAAWLAVLLGWGLLIWLFLGVTRLAAQADRETERDVYKRQDYIMADTPLPIYLPYPRFLLKMVISQTAKLLYSLLLDRSTLSQKNKWLDDEGRIYIISVSYTHLRI